MADKFLRYRDLVANGIVHSRMTLHRLIRDNGFPPGRLITPNCRAWSESEIDEWIATRPSAVKANAPRKSKRA